MTATQLTQTTHFHSFRQEEKTKAKTERVARTVVENTHWIKTIWKRKILKSFAKNWPTTSYKSGQTCKPIWKHLPSWRKKGAKSLQLMMMIVWPLKKKSWKKAQNHFRRRSKLYSRSWKKLMRLTQSLLRSLSLNHNSRQLPNLWKSATSTKSKRLVSC